LILGRVSAAGFQRRCSPADFCLPLAFDIRSSIFGIHYSPLFRSSSAFDIRSSIFNIHYSPLFRSSSAFDIRSSMLGIHYSPL